MYKTFKLKNLYSIVNKTKIQTFGNICSFLETDADTEI